MKIFQGMLAAGLLASTFYPSQTQAQLAAPTDLAATSVSSSQIDLTWTDNSSTSFQLQFATNDAFSPSTKRNIGPAGITSYEHTGLDPITTYWYRIKAKQGPSASAWSDPPAFATTAPDGVVATAVSSGAIDVNWTPNSTNTNVTGYTVRYSTAAGSCKDRPVAGGNASSTYTATGLVPSTNYNVSVKAEGGAYSSAFSAPANATTSPDGLSGTRISPLFFGQNAWLPQRIGTVDKFGDLEELLCGASYAPGGQCVPSEVFESGVKLMRYGGKTVDKYYHPGESPAQYLTMVDNMRANGIEPLLEVPYWEGKYSEQDAAALVHYINITHDRCVRYWTIANEPNAAVIDADDLVDPNKYDLDAAASPITSNGTSPRCATSIQPSSSSVRI